MPEGSASEKRAFPRFSAHLPLLYSLRGNGRDIPTETHDISAEGLCIYMQNRQEAGTPVGLQIQINGEKEISRQGRVVWSALDETGKYKTGIKLDNPALKPVNLILTAIKTEKNY